MDERKDSGMAVQGEAEDMGGPDITDDGIYAIKLKTPVFFEGKSHSTIDMSGMEEITAADMIAVSRKLTASGNVDFLQENSMEYAIELAARATGRPLEFFYGLKPADAIKVKRCVTGFLYAQG